MNGSYERDADRRTWKEGDGSNFWPNSFIFGRLEQIELAMPLSSPRI